MNPRLSYYGELDEIEMELGKESMKYVCSHAKECNKDYCTAFREHDKGAWCHPVYCTEVNARVSCIPVEPERVWCANPQRYCPDAASARGTLNHGRCTPCKWLREGDAPSSGLLQRMGMATWVLDNNWYVVGKARNGGYPIISSRFMREDEARSLALGWQGVALRWQDGLR